MPYEIKFTDYVNKLQIVVEDNTINNETSLKLPGRNTTSYGSIIAENFLHLLENFASTSAPSVPVEGQIWYDSSVDIEQLKVYNGVNWVPANGVNKSVAKPNFAQEGDLWIDRENLQLYMYTEASSWVLIGPEFSEGLITGATPRQAIGIDNLTYNFLQVDVNSSPVAVISNKEFTPKAKIDGFTTIYPGINLSTKKLAGENNLKYIGTAEKAEALIISNEVVPAGNFLRTDTVNATSFAINIQNNNGLNVGINSEFTVGIDGTNAVLKNNVSGSAIALKTRFGGLYSTVMTIDASKKVGINTNNPDTELEISGDLKLSIPVDNPNKGKLVVGNVEDSNSLVNTGSIVTYGGIGIAKSVSIGGNLYMPNTETSLIEANKILPDKDADELLGTQESYVGSQTLRYNGIFAKRFYGDLEGNVTGSVTGRAGSANKLAKSSAFSFIGDLEIDAANNNNETTVPFTGTGEGVIFPVSIAKEFIGNKDEVETTQIDDEVLLNRLRNNIGLKKISVENLLSSVPIMPIGTIVPYAGQAAPTGWLLCNGQQVRVTDYEKLFSILSYTYLPQELVELGFFAVPDLRGRFPLGVHNMGNLIPTDTRITNPIAEQLGATSGTETKVLIQENLPDHQHSLQYQDHNFYAVNQQDFFIQDNAIKDYPYYDQVGGDTGYAVDKTSGIDTQETTIFSQPFDVMNPFLVLNYIIYAG